MCIYKVFVMQVDRPRAMITGVGVYYPDYILTNEELSRMVDTSDEWIMTRVGIKERRIMKDPAKGSAWMGARAVEQLLEKTGTKPEEVDLLVCATVTPDMHFPANAQVIADMVGIKHAFGFDLNAGCSGFLYGLVTASQFVESGRYKKVVLVGAEKMSVITDYTDRKTCPLFGDAAGAVLLEPTFDEVGMMDHILRSDGMGRDHLFMKAGGSLNPPTIETVTNREHYIYQDGQFVFKHAVTNMADTAAEIMEKNGLSKQFICEANVRIRERVCKSLPRDSLSSCIEPLISQFLRQRSISIDGTSPDRRAMASNGDLDLRISKGSICRLTKAQMLSLSSISSSHRIFLVILSLSISWP